MGSALRRVEYQTIFMHLVDLLDKISIRDPMMFRCSFNGRSSQKDRGGVDATFEALVCIGRSSCYGRGKILDCRPVVPWQPRIHADLLPVSLCSTHCHLFPESGHPGEKVGCAQTYKSAGCAFKIRLYVLDVASLALVCNMGLTDRSKMGMDPAVSTSTRCHNKVLPEQTGLSRPWTAYGRKRPRPCSILTNG